MDIKWLFQAQGLNGKTSIKTQVFLTAVFLVDKILL